MSGLTKEIKELTEEDISKVKLSRTYRGLGATAAAIASVLILWYGILDSDYSSATLFMSSLFLALALGNLYILFREYNLLTKALKAGQKDVYYGIVTSKYSRIKRGLAGGIVEHVVMLKPDSGEVKSRNKEL